jgi:hypothetical protein
MSLAEKDIEATSSRDGSQHDPEIGTSEADDKTAPATETEVDEESEYVTGIKLYLIILGLCMAVFLIGLVRCCLREVS